MKVINEQGVVFGCLPKETQEEMKQAFIDGARCYDYSEMGWWHNCLPSWDKSVAYKVEVEEKKTRLRTPEELFGETLIRKHNEEYCAFKVHRISERGIWNDCDEWRSVEELHEMGYRLQLSGWPEYEGSVSLIVEDGGES